MVEPFANISDHVSNFTDFIEYNIGVTGGHYMNVVLFSLWMVFFLALRKYPKERSFATASFGTLMTAFVFWAGGLVYDTTIAVLVIANVVGVYMLLKSTTGD